MVRRLYFFSVIFFAAFFSTTVAYGQCLTIPASGQDVTCFGGNDGQITLTINAGTIPNAQPPWDVELFFEDSGGGLTQLAFYDDVTTTSFTFTPGNGSLNSTGADAFGIPANDFIDPGSRYRIEVRSTGGIITCRNKIAFVIVNQPTEIVGTVNTVTPACTPGTGAIALNVAGGTPLAGPPNYVYTWTGPTAIPTTVEDPTNLNAGTYSVTIEDANGCTDVISNIVVEGEPTITLGPNPSICTGTTVADLTYTATTGSPTQYRIDWNAGGPPDVGLTALPSSPIQITGVPLGVGTYTGTLFVRNGSCENTGNPISVSVNPLPTATISYPGSPFCATGVANVTQTGQAGGTYSSTAGLSINATTGQINLATSTAGSYTVTYTFTNGTCPNTTTANVTINALPVATISYASPFCAVGTAPVTQTGQAGGTYSSTAGLSINATTGELNLATSTPGTYTVTYSFTDGTCPNTTTANVIINALPTATISYAGNPFCATGNGNVTRTGQAGGTYSGAPAGIVINSANGRINLGASTPGTYTITYTFSNGTCSNTTTTNVTINALPTATISYPGSPFCATGVANVTQTGQAGGTYSSTAGLSINAASGQINLAASTPGTYTVTYSFTNGTCPNTTTANVTINALPTATISYAGNPFCAVGTASVTQTGQGGGTYSSTAGLVINASTGEINLVTSTPGAYTVTYSFTNGTCPNTTTTNVTINSLPTATISYPGTPFCATGTANVTQTGQGGGTYSSTAGLSINSTSGQINLATSTPGSYTVTYSFSNGTCPNTTTTTVDVIAVPTATISYAGNPFCATGTASVTQTGQGGGTYSSTAGLSINATTGEINLATSTPGAYVVTYSFTNGTCPNTATTNVTINALPTATISYATPFCATGTANVTQTGQGGGTYSSTAGLSINSGTGQINLATSTPGTYTVTYSFSNGTCPNTTTTSVTINALPTATISYPGTPFCATGTANVTQTGQGGGTYSSAAGLSINTATGQIDLAASTPGSYTVTYSFTNGTCPNTTTANVTINALPTATISYAGSPFCATGVGNVTQTGQGGGTYSSTAGLVINASSGQIDLVGSSAGTYTVTYTFTNGTCPNTTTTSVTINALPTATISYASPLCATGVANVTQTGQGSGTYSSTAGLVINATTGQIDLAASTLGTYTVTYSFANGTCPNTTTTNVTINALPAASISYTGSPFCAVGTASVTQTGQGGGTYSSAPGLSINTSTGEINLAASTPGAYVVTYSFTNGTCPNTTTANVTIDTTPTATISYAGTPFCALGTANVTRTGQAGGTYSSTAGLFINPSTGQIDLALSTPGSYTVTYNFTNGTCSNSTTTNVQINAVPTATISYAGTPFCATGTANVTQTGQGGGTYSSTAGLSINPTSGQINLAASTPGVYTVTYNFTNGSCPSSTTANVTINAIPTATISYPGTPFCATGTASVTQTGQGGGTYSSTAGLVIDASTGEIDLAASTAGTYTVTYDFTNGSCSNSTTTSVTINTAPDAGVNNGVSACTSETAFDLFASLNGTPDVGGTWTDLDGSGAVITGNTADFTSVAVGIYDFQYTVTGIAPCVNAIAVVTVTVINSTPDAGTPNTVPACEDDATFDLFASLGGTPDPGGVWTDLDASGATITGDNLDLTGVAPGTYRYEYTLTAGTCGSASAIVTVNVINAPSAGTNAPATACTASTAFDLLGSLGGTPDTGGAWTDLDGSGAVITGDLADFTSVTPGSYRYQYTVTGAAPCANVSAIVTVNVVGSPDAGGDNTVPGCDTDGAFNLFTSLTGSPDAGGTWTQLTGASLTITGNTVDINGAAAGAYTFEYRVSAAGCTDATAVVTLNVIASPDAGTNNAVTACNTSAAFDLFANLLDTPDAGGTWADLDGSGAVITGNTVDLTSILVAGTYRYEYTVTGSAPCVNATAIVTVNVITTAPNAGADNTVPACNGDNAFDLFASLGGTPDPGGSWTDLDASGAPITGNTVDLSGLTPGTYRYQYTITVAGCGTSSAIVTANVSAGPDAGTDRTVSACTTFTSFNLLGNLGGTPDSGGTWTDLDGSGAIITGNLANFSSVPVGTYRYQYTLTGTPPCGNATSILTVQVITCPVGVDCFAFTISVDVAQTVRPSCGSQNDGQITLNVAGNVAGPYILQLLKPSDPTFTAITQIVMAGTYSFPGLSPGNYEYRIEDQVGNECTQPYSLPVEITVDADASGFVNASCFGEPVGQAVVTVLSGGNAPFEYSIDGTNWVTFTSPHTITNLPPNGTYSILVRDDAADQCPDQVSVTINNTNTRIKGVFAVTNATCNANDGEIDITSTSGGVGGPYSYRLNGGPITTTLPFQNLSGGNHIITLIDNGGCERDTTIAVTFPGFVAYATPAGITPATCTTKGTISIFIPNPPGSYEVGFTTDPSAEPTNYDPDYYSAMTGLVSIPNLNAGTYYVWIRTGVGSCPTRFENSPGDAAIVVDGPQPISFEVGCRLSDTDGDGLSVLELKNISATTDYTLNYTMFGNGFTKSGVVERYAIPEDTVLGFATGEYVIWLWQDQTMFGCNIYSDTLSAPEGALDTLSVDATESLPGYSFGSVKVKIQESGAEPYEAWMLDDPFSSNPISTDTLLAVQNPITFEVNFNSIEGGTYMLYLEDANGCRVQYPIEIPIDDSIIIPNVFTPNNDEKNDRFEILNLPASGTKLSVTNRWGNEVFSSSNYNADNLWDGGGTPDGVYYYRLIIKGGKTYTGWVEIMRGSRP